MSTENNNEQKERKEKKPSRKIAYITLFLSFLALVFSVLAYLHSTGQDQELRKIGGKVTNYVKNIDTKDIPLDFSSISKKIKDTSVDFKLSESYDTAKDKIEQVKKDLTEYKKNVTPKYQKKYEELMAETESVYLKFRNKAVDAGKDLDSLVSKVDKFLRDEDKNSEKKADDKVSEEPVENKMEAESNPGKDESSKKE